MMKQHGCHDIRLGNAIENDCEAYGKTIQLHTGKGETIFRNIINNNQRNKKGLITMAYELFTRIADILTAPQLPATHYA